MSFFKENNLWIHSKKKGISRAENGNVYLLLHYFAVV